MSLFPYPNTSASPSSFKVRGSPATPEMYHGHRALSPQPQRGQDGSSSAHPPCRPCPLLQTDERLLISTNLGHDTCSLAMSVSVRWDHEGEREERTGSPGTGPPQSGSGEEDGRALWLYHPELLTAVAGSLLGFGLCPHTRAKESKRGWLSGMLAMPRRVPSWSSARAERHHQLNKPSPLPVSRRPLGTGSSY